MTGDRSTLGDMTLPAAQQESRRKAVRLQIAGLVYLSSCVLAVALVMGSSQAMKAAWIEDLLSLVPPIAFLVAIRATRRPPTEDHPYAFHRAVGSGHLAAAVALLAMGVFMVVDSASGLLGGEHPPIGTLDLAGHTVWAGWPMIAVMVYTGIGPVILGRLKMPLSEDLHDKVLHADADMNKADWMTAVGAILGILGIGVGWWWADGVAALAISASVLHDGVTQVRNATRGLMDARARRFDDSEPHPLVWQVTDLARRCPWVVEAGVRMRDQGHVFHTEVFVVPQDGAVSVDAIARLREEIMSLDWKLHDVVVAPVDSVPDVL
ncbi:cation transporter [Mobilicoccus pelagius]|uniref:Putative cation efflux protein n=1 Tax=Mobilicoccus pelagius NBRC 104925 TaxID=1089455 RepID=H5UQP4_9MICO|nr:cation transporter [Mobilicoccus pelagius]GAB48052.1 putative cation efflux protein [Mobilicoccus pelagius NBRC 104925]